MQRKDDPWDDLVKPNSHRRRSVRLKGYDYSGPGGYFVTICTKNRECIFRGNFEWRNAVVLRRGLINQTPTEKWMLMKDPKRTLRKVVRYYKARTTKLIHDAGHRSFRWQRNYYEHIIRGEGDYHAMQEYIINNPMRWHYDLENHERVAE